jgi:hypothetical protein
VYGNVRVDHFLSFCPFYVGHCMSVLQYTGSDFPFGIFKVLFKWFTHMSGVQCNLNRIAGVMVSMLTSSTVDCEIEPRSGQTKDYKIGICCFSAKHAALRRKSKDWLAQNQNNVSERALLKSNSACWSRTKQTTSLSHWKLTCSGHNIAEKLLNWR